MPRVYHLPAYLALSRLVLARRVVVIAPATLEGPRQLMRAGAREILVIGSDLPSEEGIQVRAEFGSQLPLRDASVDVVCAIESFGTMPNRRRRDLLREAHRVARPDGVFAGWIEQPDGDVFGERLRGSTTVDFWSLEDELSVMFQHVYMLAQMPWQGFSLAPVLEDDDPNASEEPKIRLEESLLADPPPASHYLAVAGKSPLPASVARECLLVPLELGGGAAQAAQVDDLADELDRLREELSVRAAKAAAAHRRVQELEHQLQSAQVAADRVEREDLEAARSALESSNAALETVRAKVEKETEARTKAEARVEELESELTNLRERAREQQGEASGVSAQLEDQAKELETRLAEREAELKAALEARDGVQSELEAKAEELEVKTAQLANLRSELEALDGERAGALAQVDGALETTRAELSTLREERASLEARAAEAERAAEETANDLKDVRRRAEELELELQRVRGQFDDQRGELEKTRARRDELETGVAQAEARASKVAEQLEALREEQRALEREGRETATSVERTAMQLDRATSDLERREAELDATKKELEALREQSRERETDLQILTRTLKDQEAALARAEAQDRDRRQQLESVRDQASGMRGRVEATESERDELRRQLDVALAEREGARSLAARVEAELEVARRRLSEQDEHLAAKIEEASRISGEAEVMRRRLLEQDAQLSESRSKAEQLSAQAEQGRMLADVALDRDRLRDELAQRRNDIQKLEERLWGARDALQKEKIEAVRLSGELERYKDQAERSRAAERERAAELESLGRSLREAEVARAELEVSLRMRNERIEQLSSEASALEGHSEDLDELRKKLEARGNQVAELSGVLEQARLRERQAQDLAARRERELDEAGRRISTMERAADDQAEHAAQLAGEVEVKEVQIEELAAQVANLQRQLQDQRNQLAMRDRDRSEIARRLEDAAAEQRSLRKQLRQREQELDDLASSQESSAAEMLSLRRELEATALASEALDGGSDDAEAWPEEARAEVRRLKAQLDTLERLEPVEPGSAGEPDRLRRFRLEAEVRATEQEFILSRLDAAEQQIWEMTDASDRNAARFAASLAQLEKQKEKVDQLVDELEVTRSLLSSEQARALEQERLLASERAKMARAGIDVSGFPSRAPEDDVDRMFADMSGPSGSGNLVDLTQRQQRQDSALEGEAGAPTPIDDRSGSSKLGSGSLRRSEDPQTQRARMVIEVTDDDDDEWPEQGAMPADDDDA